MKDLKSMTIEPDSKTNDVRMSDNQENTPRCKRILKDFAGVTPPDPFAENVVKTDKIQQ